MMSKLMMSKTLVPIGIAAYLLLGAAPSGAAPVFVDWQSVGPGSATGVLFSTTVSFSGAGTVNPTGTGPTDDFTIVNGSAQDFANAAVFSPAVQFTDAVSFLGATEWTIDFGQEVFDPIIHFTNFARTISGFSVAPQILSSNGGVTYDGVTLRSPFNDSTTGSLLPQSEGTLFFAGYHRTISFTPGTDEHLVMQFGAVAVPEPSSLMSAALGLAALAGYAGWRRGRNWCQPSCRHSGGTRTDGNG